MSEICDHPRPIVCTCGHHLGHHDRTDPCYRCTLCECGVYITDWEHAEALGFFPSPRTKSPRIRTRVTKPRRKGSARTRWMEYRKP